MGFPKSRWVDLGREGKAVVEAGARENKILWGREFKSWEMTKKFHLEWCPVLTWRTKSRVSGYLSSHSNFMNRKDLGFSKMSGMVQIDYIFPRKFWSTWTHEQWYYHGFCLRQYELRDYAINNSFFLGRRRKEYINHTSWFQKHDNRNCVPSN